MGSAINIKNSIVNKIRALTHVNQVLDYGGGNFDYYPAACVYLSSGGSEELANTRRFHDYGFSVEVYVEQGSNFPASKTERVVIETLDELIAAFNNDITLSGTVTYVRPSDWSSQFVARETDMRVLQFNVVVRKIENIQN